MGIDSNILWDQYPDNVKRRKHIGFYVSEDVYDLIRNDIVHNPNLPFAGDMGHFIRYCVARGIDDVQKQLRQGERTTWHAHKQAMRHITNERYVMAASEFVDEQASNLRVWTDERAWNAVHRDVLEWEAIIDGYGMLKARLAKAILTHPGMKGLYEQWSQDMTEEDFEKVKRVWEKWEDVAGV